jgi:hypothetical protein
MEFQIQKEMQRGVDTLELVAISVFRKELLMRINNRLMLPVWCVILCLCTAGIVHFLRLDSGISVVVQKSATVGQPKSLSGVSRFGKTNLGFPVKLIHRNTGQVLYVLLPDLNRTLEVDGQILSSAFCSVDSFMQHLEDARSLGVSIVTNMTNDDAIDHLSPNWEWTVEAFRGKHEEQCIWDVCNLFHYHLTPQKK